MGHSPVLDHCPIMAQNESAPDPSQRLTTVAFLAWAVAQLAERHTQSSPPSCSRNGRSALVTKKELPWRSSNRQIAPPPRKPCRASGHMVRDGLRLVDACSTLWLRRSVWCITGRARAATLLILNAKSSPSAQPTRRPSQTVDPGRVPIVTRSDDSIDYDDNDGRRRRQ